MRQLIIQLPQGHGNTVIDIAKSHDAANIAQIEASNSDGAIDLVIVHLSNSQVEEFLAELEKLPNVHITMIPTGIMALKPPTSKAAEQVKDIQLLSPLEIFLSGLQSIGSWKGFLGYAALAGIVVWIGLYNNTSYLLVAAMLIAPFAGPAMNTAIATARGDLQLLWRSLLRYFAALAVTITITFLLSLIWRQQIPTSLMIDSSQISALAVLIPLTAGAAGALSLAQSQRSSLVSGAAAGMLIAASLAPPAGIVGMASALGRWDFVKDGLYLLFLQLFGINLSASLLLRIIGLSTQGTRYQRGKKAVFPAVLVTSLIALFGLLTWQFSNSPYLLQSSRAQRANAQVQKAVSEINLVKLVESNIRFTRSNIKNQNTLLCVVYVQRQAGVTESDKEIRTRISRLIKQRLKQQNFNVTPLVNITVLEP